MKYLVITLSLIIAGLVSLVVSSNIGQANAIKPYLDQATSIFLITGVFTIIQKFITDKDLLATLRSLFKIHESLENTGIKCMYNESQAINFTEMIESSLYFAAIMNDGNRWFMNNIVSLENRFKMKCKTEIFTVDPESAFINSLSIKTNTSADELKRKIRDSWQKITEVYERSDKKADLTIYSIKNFPTYSGFINEKETIVSLYQCSSGRTNVPTMIAIKNNENKSFYKFVENDFNEIKAEAKIVYASNNEINA